ncbi:MAG: DUF3332 domain-containing protein [Bacteroidetes bacterium]|nr:DUF3332 domain-containing protein [Bacteroidota bacterium]MBU1677487.1 DUF3332 domain-containing protein [Bacteroidota bacterium]MBU2506367.1 DUF3332 domain-containing protein [Bacteroidota bacterium]
MRNIKTIITMLLAAAILQINTGCYGSFKLTKKVYDWNGKVGDKFVNELVFLALAIVPVYDIALLIDGIILNSIEFWTGNNPVAMNETDKEIQIVEQDGKRFELVATQNKFTAKQLVGENSGEVVEFVFNPKEVAWYMNYDGTTTKLAQLNNSQNGELFLPNGCAISFNPQSIEKETITKLIYQNSQLAIN